MSEAIKVNLAPRMVCGICGESAGSCFSTGAFDGRNQNWKARLLTEVWFERIVKAMTERFGVVSAWLDERWCSEDFGEMERWAEGSCMAGQAGTTEFLLDFSCTRTQDQLERISSS